MGERGLGSPPRGRVVSLDIGAAHERDAISASRLRFARRAAGIATTFVVGPGAMALAVYGVGMGLIESAALLVLLSGWLGPRLMRVEA